MNTGNEQPGAVENTVPTEDGTKKSRQFETFKARIVANIGVPHWSSGVQQYFIERPNLIPQALELGFDTLLANGPKVAVQIIENCILGYKGNTTEEAQRLLIWILRQSKGLVEEVVLHSPFDPDEKGFSSPIAKAASELIKNLQCFSSGCNIEILMRGIGTPLRFSL